MDDFKYLLNKESNKKCLILGGAPSIHDIQLEKFDGILISNGPGNPTFMKETIENINTHLKMMHQRFLYNARPYETENIFPGRTK